MASEGITSPTYEEVDRCEKGSEGEQLLISLGEATKATGLNWVPWVTINGVSSTFSSWTTFLSAYLYFILSFRSTSKRTLTLHRVICSICCAPSTFREYPSANDGTDEQKNKCVFKKT